MEKENYPFNDNPKREDANLPDEKSMVIPVIQEFLNIDKKEVETGKVRIKKHIVEEDAIVDIPLTTETYNIERIAVKDTILDEPPPVRQEGDHLIIPVIKEIVEIKTRYEVTEEIHLIKNKTVTPHSQKITLKKEKVSIEREPSKK